MKKILCILASLFTLSLSGRTATSTTSFLTNMESQSLIREVDNICGDTWCTGDLNFGFDQIICNNTECYFDIRAIIRSENAMSRSRPYRCHLTGFQMASDLLRIENTSVDQGRYTYTDKLYDALSQCINEEIPKHHPLVYLPMARTCRESLRKQPRFPSAAHSVYADIFHEMENKAQASAKVLNHMVEHYANLDPSCSLQYYMAFEDEVSCDRINGSREICSLPTDLGRFIVIKDYVDSAAVLYIEETERPSILGALEADSLTVKLVQPEACYTDLLNLNGKQAPQAPFSSSDHRSYFVSAKNLNTFQDARLNAAILVNRAVARLEKEKTSSGECQSKIAEVSVAKSACTTLGGISSCVLSGPNAGYYVVTGDESGGAFVTFVRFD